MYPTLNFHIVLSFKKILFWLYILFGCRSVDLQALEKAYDSGYRDAINFLLSNGKSSQLHLDQLGFKLL